jgi:hypothetical protein
VAHEQQTTRPEHAVDALEHAALRGRVEVNHHVAAKHEVERLLEGPGLAHEVDLQEFDHAPQLGLDAHQPRVRALAAQEKALQALLAQALDVVEAVNALRGRGKHARVDVARHQLKRRMRAQCLQRGDDDRIRLLARGGRIAPGAPARARGLAAQVRGEQLEVVRFAKKGREVGRERVHEFLPLAAFCALLRFEPVEVGLEAAVPGLAQAAREPAIDHGLLALVQADARALVNQRPHARKVGRRPGKFAPLQQRAGRIGNRHGV